eukprot:CAMPEP_0113473292 /NCGR_PEP_ID=MMETSP0014_2-20120614/17970_1 /TAXON_ID=2857 /ORGANISM="Nitzschia sp." /LENGTH=1003 /DNA_ID=CAMNT_0000366057 /DNA_START=237 /DNA_END=3248 /DNA_ORIENTATION=+ /assembly_acc=CAM_ASM_000159
MRISRRDRRRRDGSRSSSSPALSALPLPSPHSSVLSESSSSSSSSSSSCTATPPATTSATAAVFSTTAAARRMTTVTLLASVSWTFSVSLLFTSALSSEAAFTPQPPGGKKDSPSQQPQQRRLPMNPPTSSSSSSSGPSSSSLTPSTRNAATAAASAASTEVSTASPSSKGRRRRRGSVPLVDSSLLRYISEQKGETETQLQLWEELIMKPEDMATGTFNADGSSSSSSISNDDQTRILSDVTAADAALSLAGQATVGSIADSVLQSGVSELPVAPPMSTEDVLIDKSSQSEEETATGSRIGNDNVSSSSSSAPPSSELIEGQPSTTTALTPSSAIDGDTDDKSTLLADLDVPGPSSSFMGQFNQHRVSQKLSALGADPELAKLAGESVQRHLLVRSARRKIRIFLRRRDDLWKDTSSVSDQQLLSFDPFADGGAGGYHRKMTTAESALSSSSSSPPIATKTNGPPQDLIGLSSPFLLSREYGLDDVFEVMQDFGLSGVDICAILTHSPSIALMMPRKPSTDETTIGIPIDSARRSGETIEETLERSLNSILMKTLGLRRYDARKVLRDTPGLLSMKGSKSAEQIINIMTKLGVSEKSLSRDRYSLPLLLSRSPAGMFRLISFLCGSSVRISMDQVGPLLRRRDSRELLDAVVPIPAGKLQTNPVKPLDKRDSTTATPIAQDGSGDNDDANATIDPITEAAFWSKSREERNDRIEAIYRNMTETVTTIRNEIGTRDFSRVVTAYPNVLLLDAKRQIMPVAIFLMDELGIMDGDLASVLQLYPMLLGKGIEEMRKNVRYLEELGVREDDLGSIFRAFPALLTMDVEDMTPVVEYLKSIGVEDVGAFVTNIPPILGYSVEKDLKPKWEFLTKVYMHAGFELNKFPNYFSYPFERVIKTRYQYLSLKGISRQLIPIDAVLRFGDVDFARTIARDDDRGQAFLSFSKKRQELTQTKHEQSNQKSPKRRRQKKKTTASSISSSSTPNTSGRSPSKDGQSQRGEDAAKR